MPRAQRALPVRATPRAPVAPTTPNERAMGALSRSGVTKQAKAPDRALSTQVNLLGRHFGLIAIPLTRGRIPMEYKGVEYSVVQLTDGIGWRWEIRLDDGKNKSGSTPVSRAVAIKQAEQEIDRILKNGK
jgi:hypothetical protein